MTGDKRAYAGPAPARKRPRVVVCPDQFMTNAIARIMKIVARAQRTCTTVAPNNRTAAAAGKAHLHFDSGLHGATPDYRIFE